MVFVFACNTATNDIVSNLDTADVQTIQKPEDTLEKKPVVAEVQPIEIRFDKIQKLLVMDLSQDKVAAGTKAKDEIESTLDNFLDDTAFFNSFERTIESNPLMYKEFAVRTVENILRSQDILDDMKRAINTSRTKDEALRKVDKFLENFMGANAQDYTKMFETWVEKNYNPSIARKASQSGRQKYAAIAADWEQVKKMKGASEALKDPVKKEMLEKVKKKFDSLTEDEWMVMEKEIKTNRREIEAKLKYLDPNFSKKVGKEYQKKEEK
jgi:hypothetical protein